MVKRKDGRWQEQMTVTVAGKTRQQYFYGATKAEVLRKISEWRSQEERRAREGKPFSEVADAWWEQAQDELSPNTRRPYKAALNRAKEHFLDRDIRSITPAEISFFLRLVVRKNKMAEKTAKTQLSICNLIFRYAVQTGDVVSNPARDLEVPKGLSHEAREDASDEDIRIIRSSTSTAMGMMAYWFLYTGLRRSELLALTWEDVDIDNRIIHVRRSLVRDETKIYAKEPKTEAGVRDVPILNDLAAKLSPGKGLVFPNERGTFITENSFSRRWSNFQKRTGISCTPHQLRHSATTMLCQAVADGKLTVEDVQHIIGHAQYQTTMDVYNHYKEVQRKKAWANILDVSPSCQNPVNDPESIDIA